MVWPFSANEATCSPSSSTATDTCPAGATLPVYLQSKTLDSCVSLLRGQLPPKQRGAPKEPPYACGSRHTTTTARSQRRGWHLLACPCCGVHQTAPLNPKIGTGIRWLSGRRQTNLARRVRCSIARNRRWLAPDARHVSAAARQRTRTKAPQPWLINYGYSFWPGAPDRRSRSG